MMSYNKDSCRQFSGRCFLLALGIVISNAAPLDIHPATVHNQQNQGQRLLFGCDLESPCVKELTLGGGQNDTSSWGLVLSTGRGVRLPHDHTTMTSHSGTSGGHYLRMRKRGSATVAMPTISLAETSVACLSFWGHVTSDSTLEIGVQSSTQPTVNQPEVVRGEKAPSPDQPWTLVQRNISGPGTVQVIIVGRKWAGSSSVALDDLSLASGRCQEPVQTSTKSHENEENTTRAPTMSNVPSFSTASLPPRSSDNDTSVQSTAQSNAQNTTQSTGQSTAQSTAQSNAQSQISKSPARSLITSKLTNVSSTEPSIQNTTPQSMTASSLRTPERVNPSSTRSDLKHSTSTSKSLSSLVSTEIRVPSSVKTRLLSSQSSSPVPETYISSSAKPPILSSEPITHSSSTPSSDNDMVRSTTQIPLATNNDITVRPLDKGTKSGTFPSRSTPRLPTAIHYKATKAAIILTNTLRSSQKYQTGTLPPSMTTKTPSRLVTSDANPKRTRITHSSASLITLRSNSSPFRPTSYPNRSIPGASLTKGYPGVSTTGSNNGVAGHESANIASAIKNSMDTSSTTESARDASVTISDAKVSLTTRDSGVSPTMSDSGVSPTMSETGVLPTMGDSGVPPTMSENGVLPTMGDSGVPPTMSDSGVPSTMSDSGVPTTMSDSGVPSTMSDSGVSSTADTNERPSGSSNDAPTTKSMSDALAAEDDDKASTEHPGGVVATIHHDKYDWVLPVVIALGVLLLFLFMLVVFLLFRIKRNSSRLRRPQNYTGPRSRPNILAGNVPESGTYTEGDIHRKGNRNDHRSSNNNNIQYKRDSDVDQRVVPSFGSKLTQPDSGGSRGLAPGAHRSDSDRNGRKAMMNKIGQGSNYPPSRTIERGQTDEGQGQMIEMDNYGASLSDDSDLSDQSASVTHFFQPDVSVDDMRAEPRSHHQCRDEPSDTEIGGTAEEYFRTDSWLHADNPHCHGFPSANNMTSHSLSSFGKFDGFSRDEELTSPGDSYHGHFASFQIGDSPALARGTEAPRGSPKGKVQVQHKGPWGTPKEELTRKKPRSSPKQESLRTGPWGTPREQFRQKRTAHSNSKQEGEWPTKFTSPDPTGPSTTFNKSISFDGAERRPVKGNNSVPPMSRHVSMINPSNQDDSTVSNGPINKFETIDDLAHIDRSADYSEDEEESFSHDQNGDPDTGEYHRALSNDQEREYPSAFPNIPKIILSKVDSHQDNTEITVPLDTLEDNSNYLDEHYAKPRRIARANNPFGIEIDRSDSISSRIPKTRRLSAPTLSTSPPSELDANAILDSLDRADSYQILSPAEMTSSASLSATLDTGNRSELRQNNTHSWSTDFCEFIKHIDRKDSSKEQVERFRRMIDDRYDMLFGRKYSDIDRLHLWEPPQIFPGNLSPRFEKRKTSIIVDREEQIYNIENEIGLSDLSDLSDLSQSRDNISPSLQASKENNSFFLYPHTKNISSRDVDTVSQTLRPNHERSRTPPPSKSNIPDIVKRTGPYGQEKDDVNNVNILKGDSTDTNTNNSMVMRTETSTTTTNNDTTSDNSILKSDSDSGKSEKVPIDSDKSSGDNINSNDQQDFQTESKAQLSSSHNTQVTQETREQNGRNVRSRALPLISKYRPRRSGVSTVLTQPISMFVKSEGTHQPHSTNPTSSADATQSVDCLSSDGAVPSSGLNDSSNTEGRQLSPPFRATANELMPPSLNEPVYESIPSPSESRNHSPISPRASNNFQPSKEGHIYERIDDANKSLSPLTSPDLSGGAALGGDENSKSKSAFPFDNLRRSPPPSAKSNRLPLVIRKRINRDALYKQQRGNDVPWGKPRSISTPDDKSESLVSTPKFPGSTGQDMKPRSGSHGASLIGRSTARNDEFPQFTRYPQNETDSSEQYDLEQDELNLAPEPPYATIKQSSITDADEHEHNEHSNPNDSSARSVVIGNEKYKVNGSSRDIILGDGSFRFPFDSPLVQRAEFKSSATYKPLQHTNSIDSLLKLKTDTNDVATSATPTSGGPTSGGHSIIRNVDPNNYRNDRTKKMIGAGPQKPLRRGDLKPGLGVKGDALLQVSRV